jgi:hypothetical protein
VQKRQSSQQCHLAILGPTSIKDVCKTLVKLTPGHYSLTTEKEKSEITRVNKNFKKPEANYTLDIFAHIIALNRYEPQVSMTNQGKRFKNIL